MALKVNSTNEGQVTLVVFNEAWKKTQEAYKSMVKRRLERSETTKGIKNGAIISLFEGLPEIEEASLV